MNSLETHTYVANKPTAGMDVTFLLTAQAESTLKRACLQVMLYSEPVLSNQVFFPKK